MLRPFLLSTVALLCTAAAGFAEDPSAPFHSSLQIPGWSPAEEAQSFPKDKLWEMIDGGASIYREYGFESAFSCRYADAKGRSVLVELYTMKDEAAAYGIFSLNSLPLERRMPDVGEDAAISSDYLLMRKGKVYVSFTALTKDPVPLDTCTEVARLVAKGLPSSAPSFTRPSLPRLGDLFPGPIIFLRGSIGLLNLYPFAATDPFDTREGIAASYADNLLITLRFANETEARKSLAAALVALRGNPKYVEETANGPLPSLRDDKGRRLLFSVHASQLEIAIGPKAETLRLLLDHLR
jgi:hypothetical protein